MKIRNGITNGATDTAYNYGFRNLPHDDANDEQLEANTSSAMVPEMTRKGRLRNIVVESGVTPAAGMGPKLPHVIPRECSTQAEQQKNLKVYEDTDRDNAFLHIWQIVHQIVRNPVSSPMLVSLLNWNDAAA
jgi:hypothetical protein